MEPTCYLHVQGVIFFRKRLAFNKLKLLTIIVCGEFVNRI